MTVKKGALPAVGMRIAKSALGVLLVFIIYILRGRKGAPFYSALSVLWCMQPGRNEARSKAFQRTVGTLTGAFFGLILILIEFYWLKGRSELLEYSLISLFIIPVIYTTIVLNKKDASYFSCVVFLSIVVNHLSDANPYLFVLDRVNDTMIGIILAYFINTFTLPKKRQNKTLFVSELDEVLLDKGESMTPYSKYELNRMLSQGAQFTISTMRSPAALIPVLRGIQIKLPVIAMDGAILYDIGQNHILKKFEMTFDEVKEMMQLFEQRGHQCFVNVVIEDSIIIYYGDFKNPVEQAIYEDLHHSPFRNYMHGPFIEKGAPVYLMLIDTEERMTALYQEIEKAGYTKTHKVLKYPSSDHPGYSYIKIYHKEATKARMVEELKKLTGITDVVALGAEKEIGDLVIDGQDANEVVKKFKKVYEPYIWQV